MPPNGLETTQKPYKLSQNGPFGELESRLGHVDPLRDLVNFGKLNAVMLQVALELRLRQLFVLRPVQVVVVHDDALVLLTPLAQNR